MEEAILHPCIEGNEAWKIQRDPVWNRTCGLEAAIKKAWEMGIRRYVTEFWYKGSENWKEDLVFANTMMSEILDRQSEGACEAE